MPHESIVFLDSVRTRAHAIVTDGDRTLWPKNSAEHGIGLPYIIREFKRLHIPTGVDGVRGYLEVKRAVKANPKMDRDGAAGLQIFYARLNKAGIGREGEMEEMAYQYVLSHRLFTTWEIVTGFENRFYVSCNGSSVAKAANRIYKFKDYTSNIDVFGPTGLITGVEVRMGDGEAKAREAFDMLTRRGLSLKKSAYVGDSDSDIPALKEAGFPVASPLATDEVKAVAHFVLKDVSLLDPRVLLRA